MTTIDGVEHRHVRTNGIRLHCATAGDGPLVVLLHGFPEFWYSWRHQIPVLAQRHRVVAPDLRGYGGSDRPTGIDAYRLPALVADIEGLIQALGESSAIVVGHDWGGAVAWGLALDRPAVVRRLAILNMPHPACMIRELRRNPRQLLKSWYAFFFQLPRLPELLLGRRQAWGVGNAMRRATLPGSVTDADVVAYREAASQPGALTAALNYYRAALRHRDPRTRQPASAWPKIRMPTLMIWGEQDIALRKELTLGMEPLFEAPLTLHYVPDAGHFVHQDRPALVNEWLAEFCGAA
jgi:pimeloyl-ACP methyl ester carboxylesterase